MIARLKKRVTAVRFNADGTIEVGGFEAGTELSVTFCYDMHACITHEDGAGNKGFIFDSENAQYVRDY